MSHPHLSSDINQRIAEVNELGGVWVKDHPSHVSVEIQAQPVLPIGGVLLIRTMNTTYTLHKVGSKEFTIQGHPEYCPRPTPCCIHGSTWGGSMLRAGWVGRGMHLEFVPEGRRVVVTSQIFEVIQK